jgi:hypothetical protein
MDGCPFPELMLSSDAVKSSQNWEKHPQMNPGSVKHFNFTQTEDDDCNWQLTNIFESVETTH